jgi:hypothetical protein
MQRPQVIDANPNQLITLSSTSVQTGQRARIFIRGQNLNQLEAFQLQIFYDETQLTVARSYTYNSISSNGSSVINTAQEGIVSISFVGTSALSGSANLFYLDFDVKTDAKIQNNPLFIGINEALGSHLQPVELGASRGNIEVTERSITLRNAPLSTSINQSRVEEGDTFTMSLNLNHSVLKSAGSFDVFYDDEVLSLVSTTTGQFPSNSETLAIVNDQFRGKVHFSFISLEGINSVWPLLTFEFEVIQDIQAQTNIQVVPIQILDMDLQPLQTAGSTRSIQVIKKPPVVNVPSVMMESKTLTSIDDFHLDLSIEADSNLAIGVFEIEYNPFLVELNSFEFLDENWASNIMKLQTIEQDEGILRITYINPEGLKAGKTIGRLHFSPIQEDTPIHTQVDVRLEQAFNANYQSIILAEKTGQVHLSNQYEVRMYHQGQLIQEETTENLATINPPSVEAEPGMRFAFWESTVQGQTITYQSRFYRLGDINESGEPDESDITLLKNVLAGKAHLTLVQLRAANMLERDTISSQSELTLKDLVVLQLLIQESAQQDNE